MDTVTVILHLTGLLLLTPGSTSPNATNALFPEPRHVQDHVTRLLYVIWQDPGNCTRYQRPFCIVDLNDKDVVIGAAANSTEPSIPAETPNVSIRSSRHVPRDRYSDNPNERVRSRVTFWARDRIASCAKGWWEFADTAMMVPNVVTYELATNSVPEIRITPFPRKQSVSSRPVTAVPEVLNREVHMFLYSVSREEAERIEAIGREVFLGVATADSNLTTQSEAPPPYRSRASHYRAYYDLTGASWWNHRTQPRFLVPLEDENHDPIECPFKPRASELTRQIVTVLSAGTYSCLVAAGTPAQ